jgi:DNA-binding MarR family transcriptional regulator
MASSTGTAVGTDRGDLDLARLLTLVERTVVHRLAEVLRANGATVEEWRVLSFLSDDAGHTMTEIAEFALLQAPTLTKVVDRMVSANLVLRRPDEVDRRRVLVFPSDRGRQAVQRWSAQVRAELDDLTGVVGHEELALLKALLVTVSGRLG